jgi:tetratricopeptide (TPR) repeat protein
VSLAALCINWGFLLRGTGELQAALAKRTRAVELAEKVLRQEPTYGVARTQAFNAHGARAQLYEALGRWADAVHDWDRLHELDDRPDRWTRRVLRAVALARAGDHARAAAEVTDLEKEPIVTGEGLYNLACVCALSAGQARSDQLLGPSDRDARADRYGLQAVRLLKKLQAEGYFKDAGRAKMLQTDNDLQPLRERGDFRQLLKEIEPDRPD